jgi:hypothetical protein
LFDQNSHFRAYSTVIQVPIGHIPEKRDPMELRLTIVDPFFGQLNPLNFSLAPSGNYERKYRGLRSLFLALAPNYCNVRLKSV